MPIQLPHHKNAWKWGQASIGFELPAELAELLYTYLGESRRALLDRHLLIGQKLSICVHRHACTAQLEHIVSDSESHCEGFQSCKSDSMEDGETELDVQPDDDIELDL
ncbi:TPA: hypothetical protein ACH3X2_000502 [Trebouxia sp. C0005]